MMQSNKFLVSLLLLLCSPMAAADSYRYMHVTIDTPWAIFIFLTFTILLPFIVMAILYWRQAIRRNAEADRKAKAQQDQQEQSNV